MDVLTKVKGMITKTVTILRNHKGTALEPKRPLNQRRIDESSTRATSPKPERQPVRRRHHRVPQKPLPPLPTRRPPARKLPSPPKQRDPELASPVIQPTLHRIKHHRHSLSVPVAIVECLDSNSCTRKITGDKKELQRMYKCNSCSGIVLFCETCAAVCHDGHELVVLREVLACCECRLQSDCCAI